MNDSLNDADATADAEKAIALSEEALNRTQRLLRESRKLLERVNGAAEAPNAGHCEDSKTNETVR